MKLSRRFLFCLVLIGISTLNAGQSKAEQVTLPHEFQPDTPARANEVNENLGALVQALANIKSLKLYQDGVEKGESVLLNILKLNTGYLALAQSNSGDTNIYLGQKDRQVLYATDNCTGAVYLNNPVFDLDLHTGEVGYLFGVKDFGESFTGGLSNSEQQITIESRLYETGCVDLPPTIQNVYPVLVNNPATSGVTTVACLKKGEPAVCLPNAQLVRE